MMLPSSQATFWQETELPLMSSRADSRAPMLALQASKPEWAKAPDPVSGPKSSDLLASYHPGSSSVKMLETFFPAETQNVSQLTDAYVAGLIDGEGCLYAQQKGKWFVPRCDMGMSAKALPVLKLLHKQFGGSLTQQRDATDKWEAAWRWAISGRKCLHMLQKVTPFLQLKQQQAELLMRMDHAHGPAIKALVSELNRKGPSVDQEAGWFARHVGGRWLTPQADMFTPHGLAEYSETWPSAGMMRNGKTYRRQPWALPIAENASGLLLTPIKTDASLATSLRDGYTRSKAHAFGSLSEQMLTQHGCRNSPEFAAMMMGFPKNWARMEIQSCPKSLN